MLPPRIEVLAAARIAATMKGQLVRRRVREGRVADYLDPDRDSVIKAAKRAMRDKGMERYLSIPLWDDPDADLIWM